MFGRYLFSQGLASSRHCFATVMAMRLVGIGCGEVAVGVQNIVAAHDPESIAFGSADITLTCRDQGEFVVGGFERANMAELVASVLFQKHFERCHRGQPRMTSTVSPHPVQVCTDRHRLGPNIDCSTVLEAHSGQVVDRSPI